MHRPLSTLAAAAVLAGPTALAFGSGGFFDKPRLIAGIASAVLLAVAALTVAQPLPRSTPARLAMAGIAGLLAWTALSYLWAPQGARAQDDAERLLLYTAYFAAAFGLLGRAQLRRWVEPAVVAGAFVVVVYGLSARLLPTLVELQQSQSAEGRLEQPLTYWNATGCLAAMGLVVALRLAGDRRHPGWVRSLAAGTAPALGLGLYLSFSRGALFAFAAGVVLLLLTVPAAAAQARTCAALLLPAAAACAVASALGRVESLPAGQMGDSGQGAAMLAALAVLSAITASAGPRTAAEESGRPPRPIARVRGRWVAAGLIAVLAVSLAGIAALDGSSDAQSARKPTSASRFGSVDTVRYAFWDVALAEFRDQPLIGGGSGAFAIAWRAQPDKAEPALDAHSLYLETLGELGLVGAGCLALFLASVGLCSAGLYRRAPPVACGPLAGLLVFAVHAGLDWDWEMPAVTGVALLLAATVCAAYDEAVAT